MNRQEIFTKVKEHLLSQKVEAAEGEGAEFQCLYRKFVVEGSDLVNVLKCAAGCLIEDKYYHPRMEGVPIAYGNFGAGGVHNALTLSGVLVESDEDTFRLVKDLQNLHDRMDPKEWEERLKTIALTHELTYH